MVLAEVMRVPQGFIKHDQESLISTDVDARALCSAVKGIDILRRKTGYPALNWGTRTVYSIVRNGRAVRRDYSSHYT
jgi:hypothetical protein